MPEGPSAADIISYIGIPLAVLGVVPIFYTCINCILTVSNIRKSLRTNARDASTRSSLLSGIIEIEFPRYGLTSLDRDEPEHWTLNPHPSRLKGGSWSLLNWNKIVTGKKVYRVSYSSDLQEPQAEIDFEELLSFMLDRGAIPDAKGIHMLRLAGLWTPGKTNLLLSPDGREGALWMSFPDDTDGILSLAMQWRKGWDQRQEDSLPPSWLRIRDFPGSSEQTRKVPSSPKAIAAALPPYDEKKNTVDIKASDADSVRFRMCYRAGKLTVDAAAWDSPGQSVDSPSIDHLRQSPCSTWFPAMATAFGQSNGHAMWNYCIPETIAELSRKDALPCGVLVLCGIINEEDTPVWATKYDPDEDQHAMLEQHRADAARMIAERSLPPVQAEAQRRLREAEKLHNLRNTHLKRAQRDDDRAEKRETEALNSPRLDTTVVAQSALTYLQKKDAFDGCHNVQQAAEKVMFTMVQNQEISAKVSILLDEWKRWVNQGGMNKKDLKAMMDDVKVFCYAICLMGMLKMEEAKKENSLALDLQECIKTWRKVRLG